VVLTDNHLPGWLAEVDGKSAGVLRANHLFRAVEVSPGEHRLVFRYRPDSWLFGGTGSLLTLCAAGLWVRKGKRGQP